MSEGLKRLITVPNDTCEFMTLITLICRDGDKVVMRMVHAITRAALVPVGICITDLLAVCRGVLMQVHKLSILR